MLATVRRTRSVRAKLELRPAASTVIVPLIEKASIFPQFSPFFSQLGGSTSKFHDFPPQNRFFFPFFSQPENRVFPHFFRSQKIGIFPNFFRSQKIVFSHFSAARKSGFSPIFSAARKSFFPI